MSSSSSSSTSASALLAKLSHYDKDERYMALNDILNLQSSKLSSDVERQICETITNKLLEDVSRDVQTLSVKALGMLVKTAQKAQVLNIFNRLCGYVTAEKCELRDVYAIGLQTCVENVPEELGAETVAIVLKGFLSTATKTHDHAGIVEIMEIFQSLIVRFGKVLTAEQAIALSTATVFQLSNVKPIVRKRAMIVAAQLSTIVDDNCMNKIIVESLLIAINGKKSGGGGKEGKSSRKPGPASASAVGLSIDDSTIILTIGAIGRAAGYRLSGHVDTIVPLFLQHLSDAENEMMQTPQGDELREAIFAGLDSLVIRTPKQISPHVEAILKSCKEFVVYDPNFNSNYNEDDDDIAEDEDGAGSEDQGDDYDGENQDDDDTSWKVRTGAAHVINSLIKSRPEMTEKFYEEVADLLRIRFSERVETVCLVIMETFSSLLLSSTKNVSAATTSAIVNSGEPPAAAIMNVVGARPAVLVRQKSSVATLLQERVPNICKSLFKILRKQTNHGAHNSKLKGAVYVVLSNLVLSVEKNGLATFFPTLLRLIASTFNDRSANTRFQALSFATLLISSHEEAVIVQDLRATEDFKDSVISLTKNVKGEWYKVIAEALRCLSILAIKVRGVRECEKWGPSLCNCVLPRLEAFDIDQEIKIAAIDAAGDFLFVFGDDIDGEKSSAKMLGLLIERTKNDSTRLNCLKGLEKACQKEAHKLFLSNAVVSTICTEIAPFLRQKSRDLKQQTVQVLTALLGKAENVDLQTLQVVAMEASGVISDKNDLSLTNSTIKLFTLITTRKDKGDVVSMVESVAMVQLLKLIRYGMQSSVIIDSMTELLSIFARDVGNNDDKFDSFLKQFLNADSFPELKNKQAIMSLSECVAAVVVACVNETKKHAIISQLLQQIESQDQNVMSKHISILVIGNIGKRMSLSPFKRVHEVLVSVFGGANDDLKTAAASSLGRVVVGDPPFFLPIVMRQLTDKANSHQYLLLSSVREIITSSESTIAHLSEKDLDLIMSVLQSHCDAADEGVRIMVAECIGKLIIPARQKISPYLADEATMKSSSDRVKWTRIRALGYAIDYLYTVSSDEKLRKNYEDAATDVALMFGGIVLAHLNFPDIQVTRSALMTLNGLIHHMPLISSNLFLVQKNAPTDLAQSVLSVLFTNTKVNEELIRRVNFGPFKQTIDDGLPIRKATFICLSSLLECLPEVFTQVNYSALVKCISEGLNDFPDFAPDVPFVCHQLLHQLCSIAPLVLISEAPILMPALTKSLEPAEKKETKDAAKLQEENEKAERHEVIIRSAIRALLSITQIPNAGSEPTIMKTVESVAAKSKDLVENEGCSKMFNLLNIKT